jgi:hypothetical protein
MDKTTLVRIPISFAEWNCVKWVPQIVIKSRPWNDTKGFGCTEEDVRKKKWRKLFWDVGAFLPHIKTNVPPIRFIPMVEDEEEKQRMNTGLRSTATFVV